jgi:hypothetical protein
MLKPSPFEVTPVKRLAVLLPTPFFKITLITPAIASEPYCAARLSYKKR